MRRFLLSSAVLLALAWAGGAAFVLVWDPPVGSRTGAGEGRETRVEQGFLGTAWEITPEDRRSVAYLRRWGARFGPEHQDPPPAGGYPPEEVATWDGYDVTVRRGSLDRASGTFPLSVRYAVPRAGVLREVTVAVADSADLDLESAAWREVGAAEVREESCDGRRLSVALFGPVSVPASSAAVRVTEVRHGEGGGAAPPFRISGSLPEAMTWAERLYDRWGRRLPFRWLPRAR